MFIWTIINGKATFVDDETIDPCELCGERLSVLGEEDFDDYGCVICGAERSSRCRCDYAYESAAGK
jgi:hypothetical protein